MNEYRRTKNNSVINQLSFRVLSSIQKKYFVEERFKQLVQELCEELEIVSVEWKGEG